MSDDAFLGGNRNLSAVQFRDHLDAGAWGGSMNLTTGEILKPNAPGFMVAKARYAKGANAGKRIQTRNERDADFTPSTILSHAQRIYRATGGSPDTYLGDWIDREAPAQKQVHEIDASRRYMDHDHAAHDMLAANEKAMWVNHKMDEEYSGVDNSGKVVDRDRFAKTAQAAVRQRGRVAQQKRANDPKFK